MRDIYKMVTVTNDALFNKKNMIKYYLFVIITFSNSPPMLVQLPCCVIMYCPCDPHIPGFVGTFHLPIPFSFQHVRLLKIPDCLNILENKCG